MTVYYLEHHEDKRWKLLQSYDKLVEVTSAYRYHRNVYDRLRVRKVQTTIVYEKPTKEIK